MDCSAEQTYPLNVHVFTGSRRSRPPLTSPTDRATRKPTAAGARIARRRWLSSLGLDGLLVGLAIATLTAIGVADAMLGVM